jgi:hypothetical protein
MPLPSFAAPAAWKPLTLGPRLMNLLVVDDDPQPGVNVLVDVPGNRVIASRHASVQDLAAALLELPAPSRLAPLLGDVE